MQRLARAVMASPLPSCLTTLTIQQSVASLSLLGLPSLTSPPTLNSRLLTLHDCGPEFMLAARRLLVEWCRCGAEH